MIRSRPDKYKDLKLDKSNKENHKFSYKKWENFKNRKNLKLSKRKINKRKSMIKLLSVIKMPSWSFSKESKSKEMRMRRLLLIWNKRLRSKHKLLNSKSTHYIYFRRIKEEKEKEIQRLRELQEKASDRQA